MEPNQPSTNVFQVLETKLKDSIIYLINPCIPLFLYVISCNSRPPDTVALRNQYKSNYEKRKNDTVHVVSYDSAKKMVQKEKVLITRLYHTTTNKTQVFNKASQKFIALFENTLLPYWMGTKWDFNGTTREPGRGAIACGYFVSTTLYDMSVPVNIIKCGQAASDITMKTLIQKEHYKNYTGIPFAQFIKTLKARKPFLAMVGLDKHTGYLLYNGKELFFVHSSYINRRGVVKQVASESPELSTSKWKSVGYLTDDSTFLKKWIL
jgi:hypothetical protein